MIKMEKVTVHGLEEAIRGMRNPMNSWDKSDSGICKSNDTNEIDCHNCRVSYCSSILEGTFQVGRADHKLMMKLAAGGSVHAKYRRMITVYLDIIAPLYWWKEFDTYKVGTVANSCSTMHKIHQKKFGYEDFSYEHLLGYDDLNWGDIIPMNVLDSVIQALNFYREKYLETEDKQYWWQMIQLLPSSYNQKRTVMLNYEVLAGIYPMRKEHKLDEWRKFCQWIEKLPYSEIIISGGKGEKDE